MNYKFILRSLLSIAGIVLLVSVLLFVILSLHLTITASGIGYILGASVAFTALILSPWLRSYAVLFWIGVAILIAVAGMRLVAIRQSTGSNIRMIALPEGKETRSINYLIDEQDGLIFGEMFFHLIGGDSDNEHQGLSSSLFTDYSELRRTQKLISSPIVSTYLNLQQPTHFDAVVIEPDTDPLPKFAVVFLHGYMGNVTAQCWGIAQAVKVFGAVTVCPSTAWTGAWWEPDGQAILRETFQYVRSRGIGKFYLGGFSNGGISINRLTSKLKREQGLAGLIFIDGISDGASIQETNLPVLIIQGTHDERIPVAGVRQVVKEIGDAATYVELDADHFLIMKQPRRVQYAIAKWLETFNPALEILPAHFDEK